jgi:hypothetical protein
MNRIWKFFIFSIILIGFASSVNAKSYSPKPCSAKSNVAVKTNAQVGTFLAIQTLVQEVTQQLNNIGITLGGEGNILIGNASQELNLKLEELRRLVGENVNAPIASLGLDVQELARQLTSSVQSLRSTLIAVQGCIFQNVDIVLSTASNITQELKRLPIIDNTKPQVSYFQFDGAPARAVPINGGRLTVKGVKLWTDRNYPPLVKLQSPDRATTFQTPTAEAAGNDGSFSIVLDDSSLRENAGQCLQLSVEARERKGFIFKKTETTQLYLPMCISPNFKTEFVVESGISYDTTEIRTDWLGELEFRDDNDSCENKKNVSISRNWDLPAGGRIVEISVRQGEFHRRDSGVNFAITSSSTVAANGWFDTANCVLFKIPPFGPTIKKLISTAIFQKFARPKIQYSVTNPNQATATSAKVQMSLPNTQIRLEIPKNAETPNTTFWFKVTKYVNGVKTSSQFESARIPVNAGGGTSPVGKIDNLDVTGRFNPRPINGKAELLVTIQAPTCE